MRRKLDKGQLGFNVLKLTTRPTVEALDAIPAVV